jgi:hypothetical protein
MGRADADFKARRGFKMRHYQLENTIAGLKAKLSGNSNQDYFGIWRYWCRYPFTEGREYFII